MNHNDWINLGLLLLSNLLSFFGAHYGATNAVNAANKNINPNS